MFEPKYFDRILQLQKEGRLPTDAPVDLDRLRSTGIGARIGGWLTENPRWWLALFRRFLPRARLGRYMLVTRGAEVREILERGEDFQTPYGPEMAEAAGGAPFILGLQDGAEYRRLKPLVLAAFPPGEIEARVRPLADRLARAALEHAAPPFDAVAGLLRPVPVRICREYFGLSIDDEEQFADWAIALSALFFSDPGGDGETRELALAAAGRMLVLIGLSLDRAEGNAALADTPVGRLAAMEREGSLERAETRAILMGMIAGFVPTNVLAGGNCLDVILERPDARAALDKALAANDTPAFDRAVREAMRFKPIWIGPWRYVPADTVLARGTPQARTIPARTVVMPATLSAMFDPELVADPDRFDPDRPARDYMVFGHGIHACIGAELARVQIGECFRALLALPGLRRAQSAEGRLGRVGAYPERLRVDFTVDPLCRTVEHATVTVCCPARKGVSPEAARDRIAQFGNPASPALREALDHTGIVHFASLSFVEADDAGEEHFLVLELSADGTGDEALRALVLHAGPLLRPLFAEVCGLTPGASFERFLRSNSLDISPTFGKMSGLVFSGTPGHSLARMRAEAKLAGRVQEILLSLPSDMRSAAATLDVVRETLRREGGFAWAFAPAQSLLEMPAGSIAAAARRTLAAPPVAATVLVVILLSWWFTYAWVFEKPGTWLGAAAVGATALLISVMGAIATAIALFGLVSLVLRRRENRDVPEAASIPLAELEALQARENRLAQNHLFAVSRLKPGRLRRLSLRLAFYLISISARMVFRPGYLSDLNTIHFARWVKLPGTDRLVFLSNYDGSWDSYLEDFITKAAAGMTGVWSNTLGFPRTRWLFLDGARDGERFKRWARRQQRPTLFWYAALPGLTTGRIRTHSAVRRGIAEATSGEARDWLRLFGSMPPRPAHDARGGISLPKREPPATEILEAGEIQSILFGPMGALSEAAMLGFSVPEGMRPSPKRELIEWILARASFGDRLPERSALVAAFGPDGLARLGLEAGPDGDPLRSFPAAFRQGMGNPARGRALGHVGDDAPERWEWGAPGEAVDLLLLLYAREPAELQVAVADAEAVAARTGLSPVVSLPLSSGKETKRDHFGFRDGVSQPVIRGSRRAARRFSPMHEVAAGEFLFGYPDEHGFLPVSPSVSGARDPAGVLAALPDDPAGPARDFGRNGSFLVARQLRQDAEGFEAFCSAAVARLPDGATPEWVAAKMVGRWPDGSSLVRNPEGAPDRGDDNEFSFAMEDPQGLRCPFGSHVRRVNPRDSLGSDPPTELKITNRHRILRAGRLYSRETPAGTERGLLFLCLNADIERQYEFIQQSWIQSPTFHGLSGERDPLLSDHAQEGRFSVPEWEGAEVISGLRRFVSTRGGGYFFVPSLSALRYLASRCAEAQA